DSNAIYYDVMSPLVNSQDETIAVLVFRIDPNYYIFPRLQSWPIPTKTAEIQIVRKIDDNVIIINELKNIKNSAFQINIPLANKNFPAVQAVNGREGIYEGKDYRGQKVLTDMRPIPETPFYIITKVDTYEVFSEIYYREYIIIIISILIIIITGLSSYIIYGFYKKN
ncbi:MAG: hypothetical protein KA792_09900, partial [Bacteroidales bacterium]|nr:hypothetical protein [Bacteroidales bacterium]